MYYPETVRVANFIIYSLIIHLVLVLLFQQVPKDILLAQELTNRVGIEVEVVNKPMDQEQQIVRSADAPQEQLEELDKLKEKAKYLSEKTQRVIEETKAQLTGQTKNRIPQPRFLQDALQEKSRQLANNRETEKTPDGEEAVQKQSQLQKRVRKELYEVGPSTMGDALPKEMAVGSFTALNTDKFTFYSFYSRVEDLIRFRWEQQVEQATQGFDRGYISQVVSKKSWVTQLEFLLTPNGEFIKARILQPSGVSRYDQAPISAFKDARIFPNPPKELVQADGYIHLVYAFQVNFDPAWTARR